MSTFEDNKLFIQRLLSSNCDDSNIVYHEIFSYDGWWCWNKKAKHPRCSSCPFLIYSLKEYSFNKNITNFNEYKNYIKYYKQKKYDDIFIAKYKTDVDYFLKYIYSNDKDKLNKASKKVKQLNLNLDECYDGNAFLIQYIIKYSLNYLINILNLDKNIYFLSKGCEEKELFNNLTPKLNISNTYSPNSKEDKTIYRIYGENRFKISEFFTGCSDMFLKGSKPRLEVEIKFISYFLLSTTNIREYKNNYSDKKQKIIGEVRVNKDSVEFAKFVCKEILEILNNSIIRNEEIISAIVDLEHEISNENWIGIKKENVTPRFTNFGFLLFLLFELQYKSSEVSKLFKSKFDENLHDYIYEVKNKYSKLNMKFTTSPYFIDDWDYSGFKISKKNEDKNQNIIEFSDILNNKESQLKILITGLNGSGKTNIVNFSVINCFKSNLNIDNTLTTKIPVVVNLNDKNIKVSDSVENWVLYSIEQQLNYEDSNKLKNVKKIINNINTKNDLKLFIIYDNINYLISDEQNDVIAKINLYLSENQNVDCLLTCYAESKHAIELLTRLGFIEYNLEPLSEKHIKKITVNFFNGISEHYKQLGREGIVGEEVYNNFKHNQSLMSCLKHPRSLYLFLELYLHQTPIFQYQNYFSILKRIITNELIIPHKNVDYFKKNSTTLYKNDFYTFLAIIALLIVEKIYTQGNNGQIIYKIDESELFEISSGQWNIIKKHLTRSGRNLQYEELMSILNECWLIEITNTAEQSSPKVYLCFTLTEYLFYFASYAIVRGIGKDDNKLNITNAVDNIKTYIPKWAEKGEEFVDLGVNIIAQVNELFADELIECFLIEEFNNDNNKIISRFCNRVISKILCMNLSISSIQLDKMIECVFSNRMHYNQIADIDMILNSPIKESFFNRVFNGFFSNPFVHFPKYAFLIGYFDTQIIFNNMIIENKYLKSRINLFPNKSSSKETLQNIVDYIMNNLFSDQHDVKIEVIRNVLVLSTISWWNRWQKIKSQNSSIPDLSNSAIKCLLYLLNSKDTCIANISCYALDNYLDKNVDTQIIENLYKREKELENLKIHYIKKYKESDIIYKRDHNFVNLGVGHLLKRLNESTK